MSELEKCIIVDIDGTLALRNDRSPYQWDKVGEDAVNEPVVYLVKILSFLKDSKIILFSGRDSICRNQTEKWLKDNEIFYDSLHMRPQDNCEKDSVIKKRMFEQIILGKYDVRFVLDDRNQVVEMWRELGLTCFQVADGNF